MPALIGLSEFAPSWYEARFSYNRDLIDAFKSTPGCRWNPEKKVWIVPAHALPAITAKSGAQFKVMKACPVFMPPEIPSLTAPLREYQKDGVRTLLGNTGFVLGWGMRVGKGGRPNDRILTPSGWTTYAKVRKGDFVIGANGKATRVVGVFDRGVVPFMRVTFSDGVSVSVSEDHLWRVRTAKQRFFDRSGSVLSTKTMHERGVVKPNGNSRWFIPMVEPIEFDSVSLPVDPYVVGVLLGDGYLGSSTSFTPGDDLVPIEVVKRLPSDTALRAKRYTNKATSYTIKGFMPYARQIGLVGRAWEKLIPRNYLFASPRDRLALLCGLLDTDGHFSDHHIEFSSASRQLAEDVRFLVESLGGVAAFNVREQPMYSYRGEKHVGRPSYRLLISLPLDVTPTIAFVDRWKPRSKFPPVRAIRAIEPDGEDQCICIKVEADDQLYVTEHCVVTHNTPTAVVSGSHLLASSIVRTVLVLAPNAVLSAAWTKAVPRFSGGLKLETVEGTGGIEQEEQLALMTVPYLFIGCHYELLTGSALADKTIDYSQTVKDLLTIVRSRGPYVVIADELHEIRDRKKPRAQFITESIARDPLAIRRWALTGTPLRNYPADMYVMWNFVQPDSMGSWSKYTARYAGGYLGDHGWKADGRTNEDELSKRLSVVCWRLSRQEVAPWLPKADRKVILCDMTKEELKTYRRSEAALGSKALAAMQKDDESTVATGALKQLASLTTGSKIPTAVDRVRYHTEERSTTENRPIKALVFAYMHETLNSVWDALETAKNDKRDPFLAPVFVAGGWMTKTKREESIEQWKATPGSAVLLANALSSGRGIDLADADVTIFVELSWVPADFLQAEARSEDIHLGKRTTTGSLYEYLLVRGTVDENMARLLIEKIQAVENVVGSDDQTRGVHATLREAGVVDRSVLTLTSEDPQIVASVLDDLRSRLFGEDREDVKLSDNDNADEEEADDDEEEDEDEDA